jgi:hypothetical protein
MSRINIPFVGASNKSRSVEVSTQRSVNLFPELDPLSGFQQALYLRPQLAIVLDGGISPRSAAWRRSEACCSWCRAARSTASTPAARPPAGATC